MNLPKSKWSSLIWMVLLVMALSSGLLTERCLAQQTPTQSFYRLSLNKHTAIPIYRSGLDGLRRSTKLFCFGLEYRFTPKFSLEARAGFLPKVSHGPVEGFITLPVIPYNEVKALDLDVAGRFNLIRVTSWSVVRGEVGATYLQAKYFTSAENIKVHSFGGQLSLGIDNNIGRVRLNLRLTSSQYLNVHPQWNLWMSYYPYFTIGYGFHKVQQ